RTRVVSTANRANLKYEEAAPELSAGLTRSLSGLF
ncbi:MAG: complement resistance protein TraT, partial [Candidatus Tectomicrobia bacterium]|nr:complement resistance protein TraT [Candidatus Tectomicrobia bacterium]